MPQYLIVYLGGEQSSSPEQGQQHRSKYMDWLTSLGDAVISPANPLMNTQTIDADGTITAQSTTLMSGYTIIETDSMESALSITKRCPFLEIGGRIEVSERIDMPG
ncbi:MAG: YciI family protein [Pseudomonadales bacterium]|nr:YciI family protein [Pseudomonadales bacterium]